MAKAAFSVPPVVFPSGGNPSGSPQQRRAPTVPFQPSHQSSNLPFMSFDIASASATTTSSSSSSAYPYASADGMFEDELPLLEELGINTRQIWRKTLSILNPIRTINPSLHEDADLSGPFLFLMAFGLFQLLAGKLHFGIVLGWITVAALFLYVVFNMLAGRNGNLDLYRCLSLLGYCMLPMVIFSAFALFVPQVGVLLFGAAGVFVLWSTRACTRLLVELASCGDEHKGKPRVMDSSTKNMTETESSCKGFEDEDDLFEINLDVVDKITPSKYWDVPSTITGTGSVLLANCLLPIAEVSRAVPANHWSESSISASSLVMLIEPIPKLWASLPFGLQPLGQ